MVKGVVLHVDLNYIRINMAFVVCILVVSIANYIA